MALELVFDAKQAEKFFREVGRRSAWAIERGDVVSLGYNSLGHVWIPGSHQREAPEDRDRIEGQYREADQICEAARLYKSNGRTYVTKALEVCVKGGLRGRGRHVIAQIVLRIEAPTRLSAVRSARPQRSKKRGAPDIPAIPVIPASPPRCARCGAEDFAEGECRTCGFGGQGYGRRG